eukprot:5949522-Amphidinium_carterae.1
MANDAMLGFVSKVLLHFESIINPIYSCAHHAYRVDIYNESGMFCWLYDYPLSVCYVLMPCLLSLNYVGTVQ